LRFGRMAFRICSDPAALPISHSQSFPLPAIGKSLFTNLSKPNTPNFKSGINDAGKLA